jgi:hypothetical protein
MNSWKPKYHNNKARLDRFDIYNNLPIGGLSKIAENCSCSIVQVKNVLEGYRKDNQGIIETAELMAAVNIWKTRFCKHKSKL